MSSYNHRYIGSFMGRNGMQDFPKDPKDREKKEIGIEEWKRDRTKGGRERWKWERRISQTSIPFHFSYFQLSLPLPSLPFISFFLSILSSVNSSLPLILFFLSPCLSFLSFSLYLLFYKSYNIPVSFFSSFPFIFFTNSTFTFLFSLLFCSIILSPLFHLSFSLKLSLVFSIHILLPISLSSPSSSLVFNVFIYSSLLFLFFFVLISKLHFP
uniref:Uncharacterized protein n=1 Tax=Cacopsylla melanoneura TaxID=428564 RepID=A0A8D8T3Q9_9HEMI